jgi:catechol 2,3-dioxygenase-like lactoylglutathione lyase family enzyme
VLSCPIRVLWESPQTLLGSEGDIDMSFHLRSARPVRDLARSVEMYKRGLGLQPIGYFLDHDGFDGVMLGLVGADYHFEFTYCHSHPITPTPTPEDLCVFYLPDQGEWVARCAAMLEAGFLEVKSFNPYWDMNGRTFEDPDGYRVVLQRSTWRNRLES